MERSTSVNKVSQGVTSVTRNVPYQIEYCERLHEIQWKDQLVSTRNVPYQIEYCERLHEIQWKDQLVSIRCHKECTLSNRIL